MSSFFSSQQFCYPRAQNPGNVLLTSRNPPKYFHQCSNIIDAILFIQKKRIATRPNSNQLFDSNYEWMSSFPAHTPRSAHGAAAARTHDLTVVAARRRGARPRRPHLEGRVWHASLKCLRTKKKVHGLSLLPCFVQSLLVLLLKKKTVQALRPLFETFHVHKSKN